MRILIVSTFFPPQNSIASLRPYSWAKYWSKAGHDVTVITTSKPRDLPYNLNFSTDEFKVIEVDGPQFTNVIRREYQASKLAKNHQNVPGWRQKIKQKLIQFIDAFRNKTGVLNGCRMPDLTDLWIRPALKAARQEPYWDCIVSTAGPYAVHVVACSLKKSGHAGRWVADYRDNWSDSYVYPGLFPFNWLEGILERNLLRHADAITTVSLPYAQLYSSKYCDKKVVCIENGFDVQDLINIDQSPIFPNDGKYRIVHTGTIYNDRKPTGLFEAIALMRNDPESQKLLEKLQVIFVGPNQGDVPKMIQDYGISECVSSLGFVKREDALRMQRDAHALLFVAWNSGKEGMLTGKIFEYLFSGTPIIGLGKNLETAQKLILETKAGVVLSEPMELATFLKQHLTNPVKKRINVNEAILKKYGREHLAMKLLKVLGD